MARPLTYLDVFTPKRLEGNQLAVVHEADDLDAAIMLRFARETRLSETTFVQAPTEPGADYRNRIFTMGGELLFAGHPSLGTAVAVARRAGLDRASYTQQTPAGLQPIDVELRGNDLWGASMLQGPATFGTEVDRADVATAVGLFAEDMHPDLPPQVVSCGQPQLIAPVASAAVLNRVAPTYDGVRSLLDAAGATTVYLASASGERAEARSFFTDPGELTEDPATGSAAGPLCAYLAQRVGMRSVRIFQGVAMGRPSVLDCAVEGDRIRVGGDVVVVSDGTLLV